MPEYPDRQSTHLKWYDYSSAGRYAVTICTRDRELVFGEIRAERMYFSEIGRIVRTFWYALPDRFPGVRLDAFALMPNHVHGIVIIPSRRLNVENMPERFQPSMRALMQERHPELRNYEPPTLGDMMRDYKGAATYRIHRCGFKAFAWQNRYWGEVLFTEADLQHARRYIYENPRNWGKDKFYKK